MPPVHRLLTECPKRLAVRRAFLQAMVRLPEPAERLPLIGRRWIRSIAQGEPLGEILQPPVEQQIGRAEQRAIGIGDFPERIAFFVSHLIPIA